ncbi:hypothetical protein WKV44_07555 [Spirochaetia bacterium 38H-sp]|uniref:Uncharacterized protein n=1 Tax=Rarispira pelagica TaxID=3141764 RepID=A0ABU9UCK2_9SPIR
MRHSRNQDTIISPIINTGRKSLWQLVNSSACKQSHSVPFLSAVQLDNLKAEGEKLGLEKLFTAYVQHGSEAWLNPYPLIKKLDKNLQKYLGQSSALSPLIDILTDLAKNDISPHSFMLYVVIPRMQDDFSWREWRKTHYRALKVIADMLIELRKTSPFEKQFLGDKHIRLNRDIVLAKYAGQPLSLLGHKELEKRDAIVEYIAIWKNIKIVSGSFIRFIRNSVLGLLYNLRGKYNLEHVIQLLSVLPELEGCLSNLPPDKIDSISLYNASSNNLLDYKLANGYTPMLVLEEAEFHMRIIKKLLPKPLGLEAASFITYVIKRQKDHRIINNILYLSDLLPDKGSLAIYKWHIKNLLNKTQKEQLIFIKKTKDNRGLHPDYPNIEDIFSDDNVTNYKENFSSYAKNLNTEPSRLRGARDIIKAYIEKTPAISPVIDKIRDDILEGRDRLWSEEKIKLYDKATQLIHAPLLRTIIPGIGSLFYTAPKSHSFSELFAEYPIEHNIKIPYIRHSFTLSTSRDNPQLWDSSEIKERINLSAILDTAQAFRQPHHIDTEEYVFTELSKELLSMRGPLQKIKKEMGDNKESKLENLKRSQDVIQQRQKDFRRLLALYKEAPSSLKFMIALILSSSFAKKNNLLKRLVLIWTVKRYMKNPLFAKQQAFFAEDLVPDDISLMQFKMLLKSMELMFSLINSDSEIRAILESLPTELHSAFEPFLITRRKLLGMEAIDAAIKKLSSYHALLAEHAKWQELISKTYNQESDIRQFLLYVSKSSIDAYYGDMGGICASDKPEFIKDPAAFTIRLVNGQEKTITGMGLLYFNTEPNQALARRPFWFAFAINPLPSLCHKLTNIQLLIMYLNYRILLEKISKETGYPVLLPGISSWGIISNNDILKKIITEYEIRKQPLILTDAKGLSFYYNEYQYAHAACIIDPNKPQTFTAEQDLKKLLESLD